MIDFAYYLLKVTICSGIFFLYYLLALRNKLFHQWSRFYLLITVLLSLLAPLLQFTIWHQFQTQQNQAIELLRIVGSANSYLDEITITNQSSVSFNYWIIFLYASVSLVLLALLCISLFNIFLLIKKHTVSLVDRIKFINTDAKGTPFSFLEFIFWNRAIDIQSETGQQIFQHELVHVKEKHTVDKLFMQIVIIVFWCNPFFWLIRRELKLIHEFIADKKAIAEHGTAALAAMILQSAYPSQFNSITNQFFQTSIKRRLAMLSKIQNPRINYISRLIALPLLAITVFAFTVRTKNTGVPNIALEKTFTVVIDAGHGMQGDHYTGATSGKLSEDQIALAISKKVKELNTNDKIKIVFSRSSDQLTDLTKRVDVAKENNANLFISVHLNAAPSPDSTGIEVCVSNKNTVDQNKSELIGSILQQELAKIYNTKPFLVKRQVGIYVLDQNICPAVMVECGYLTNSNDRQFISNDANQSAVAKKILAAIQRYAAASETSFISSDIDTVPRKIKSVNVDKHAGTIIVTYQDDKKEVLKAKGSEGFSEKPLYVVNGMKFENGLPALDVNKITAVHILKGEQGSSKYGDKGKNGVVEIITNEEGFGQPLYIVDGKITGYAEMNGINPNDIESINVLKGDGAISKYGDKAKDGVVEITMKKKQQPAADTIPEKIFTKTEIEPSVDKKEWTSFLSKNLQPFIVNAAEKGMSPGQYTVVVKFLIRRDGSVGDIKAVKDPGYGLGETVVKFMKDSPKWKPALQNGKPVSSYHEQPVTFVIQEQ
jgi:N-acetylmuramoyl-L-alanine amidase